MRGRRNIQFKNLDDFFWLNVWWLFGGWAEISLNQFEQKSQKITLHRNGETGKSLRWNMKDKEHTYLFNKPSLVGAVLQSPSWLISSLIKSVILFVQTLPATVYPNPQELGGSHVRCHMSGSRVRSQDSGLCHFLYFFVVELVVGGSVTLSRLEKSHLIWILV